MSTKYKFQNPEGIYFISFSTINWIDIFTRREYKDFIVDNLNYYIENKGLILYAWVIMSNHMHLIVSSKNDNTAEIIRNFKRYTSRYLIDQIMNNPKESRRDWILQMCKQSVDKSNTDQNYQFWQHDNHPIEIDFSTNSIDTKIEYIHDNPVKAGFVDEAWHYPYSSAIDYCDGTGRVKIQLP